MKSPTVATLKKLFALSGNRCAFPKCTSSLVEEVTGILVGKVCHIKGKRSGPGSKRYDKNQKDNDRHGIENLIALCPKHHDVIDDDEESYTVERLVKMKADHEQLMREKPPADDALAEKFALAVHNNSVIGGSIINTSNQSGGQTAHTIVNYHLPSREVSDAVVDKMIARLQTFAGEPYRVVALSNDVNTLRLARRLEAILQLSGWHCQQKVSVTLCPDSFVGDIILGVPRQKPSVDVLLDMLQIAGLDARSEIMNDLEALEISVIGK